MGNNPALGDSEADRNRSMADSIFSIKSNAKSFSPPSREQSVSCGLSWGALEYLNGTVTIESNIPGGFATAPQNRSTTGPR